MIYLLKDEIQCPIPLDLYKDIPYERKLRIQAYVKEQDKRNCILGYLLLKYSLLISYGIGKDGVAWNYSKYGKPFLKEHPEIFFNISHSGKYVVCAIDEKEIGIDIQEMLDIKYFGLVDLICNEKEKEKIQIHNNPLEMLTRYWALKESFLKSVGIGICDNMEYINFSENDNDLFAFRNKYFHVFYRHKYIIASCYSRNVIENINKISVRELMQTVR